LARAAFAEAVLRGMDTLFSAYGLDFIGTWEDVNPTGPSVAVEFGNSFHPLPGIRRTGAAHLYVVDSIYLQGASPGSGSILGFAPREAVDLHQDPESRVVLNVRMRIPSVVANTAAHELGHFFGLRHTTASDLDMQYDDDFSNLDDGFLSTPVCPIPLSKSSAVPAFSAERSARPQFQYVAAPVFPSPAVCGDVSNLMFPYACEDQVLLTSEQQVFLRRNLRLLKGN
jgi:hypothetical protein